MQQLELDIKSLESHDDATLAEFARANFEAMKAEAIQAKQLATTAFQKAWMVGKACVVVGDRIGEERFEEWARANISEDYYALYRCTILAISSPERPPLKPAAQYKQLQIALGEEPEPKITPRKSDHKLVNFKAGRMAIKRFWGFAKDEPWMDKEMLAEIEEDLRDIVAIHAAILQRLEETP